MYTADEFWGAYVVKRAGSQAIEALPQTPFGTLSEC